MKEEKQAGTWMINKKSFFRLSIVKALHIPPRIVQVYNIPRSKFITHSFFDFSIRAMKVCSIHVILYMYVWYTLYRGGHEKSGGSKICTLRAFDLIPSAFNRSRNFKTT